MRHTEVVDVVKARKVTFNDMTDVFGCVVSGIDHTPYVVLTGQPSPAAEPGSQRHVRTPSTQHQLYWCDALMTSSSLSSLIVCGGEKEKEGERRKKEEEGAER